MTSVLLKTLNNYPEVKTDAGIDGIIAYLNSAGIVPRVFPANVLTNVQRNRYANKFMHFVVVAPNNLFYRPSPRISLQVIRPATRLAVLNALWNNPREGLGVGVNAFY